MNVKSRQFSLLMAIIYLLIGVTDIALTGAYRKRAGALIYESAPAVMSKIDRFKVLFRSSEACAVLRPDAFIPGSIAGTITGSMADGAAGTFTGIILKTSRGNGSGTKRSIRTGPY